MRLQYAVLLYNTPPLFGSDGGGKPEELVSTYANFFDVHSCLTQVSDVKEL